MTSWKRDAISGLVVLIPILITVYLVAWVYWQVAALPLLTDIRPPVGRVLLIMFLFALLVLTVGFLTRTTVGTLLETKIDETMDRLPGLRIVYNASKTAVETTASGPTDLQQPVRVRTWTGLQMTAFKTGTTTPDGRAVLFIPTSPNPTTGFVVEVEPEEIDEIDESVEDALTRVLSGGFSGSEPRTGLRADTDDGHEDQYLTYFIPMGSTGVAIAALIMAAILTGVNYYGVKETGALQNVIVIALIHLSYFPIVGDRVEGNFESQGRQPRGS